MFERRYTKCYFYRSDGTPRARGPNIKGCPQGTKCAFAHPGDTTWDKAITVSCPQEVLRTDNRFRERSSGPSPRRQSRSRTPPRERGRRERSPDTRPYRSPDKPRRDSDGGRWARRSPDRSRSESRKRRSRERSASASRRDIRVDDRLRDTINNTTNRLTSTTVSRDPAAVNVQSPGESAVHQIQSAHFLIPVSATFRSAHSAPQTPVVSVSATPVTSAPPTPVPPTPAFAMAPTPVIGPRLLDPRLRAKAPAALRPITTPILPAEPNISAPPTPAPPTSVPPMQPSAMPPPLPPSAIGDAHSLSRSDPQRPIINTDVEMTDASPRHSVGPTPTSATVSSLPKFKFSMTTKPPPTPITDKAGQRSGSLPSGAPPGWTDAIEKISKSSKIKREIIELDERERTMTRFKDSLSSRQPPPQAIGAKAAADKAIKETTDTLLSIRSKRKALEQELASSFAEMGYVGMTVRDGRLRGAVKPVNVKATSPPLHDVIENANQRVNELNTLMQELQARQQVVQEKLAALKKDDNMMDTQNEDSNASSGSTAKIDQLAKQMETLRSRMEEQETQTKDAKKYLHDTQQQMERTIEARLDGLPNRREPRQLDAAARDVMNRLEAQLVGVNAELEEFEAGLKTALDSSEEQKAQINAVRNQVEEARNDARARKQQVEAYSKQMTLWSEQLDGILEDQITVPDMADDTVAALVDERMKKIINDYQEQCRAALEDAQRTAKQNQSKLHELFTAAQALHRRPQAGPSPQRR